MEFELGSVLQGDRFVQVDIHGAMIRAVHLGIDIPAFDPRSKAWCAQDQVDSRAVVGGSGLSEGL
jgi:hypothetical protein